MRCACRWALRHSWDDMKYSKRNRPAPRSRYVYTVKRISFTSRTLPLAVRVARLRFEVEKGNFPASITPSRRRQAASEFESDRIRQTVFCRPNRLTSDVVKRSTSSREDEIKTVSLSVFYGQEMEIGETDSARHGKGTSYSPSLTMHH